MDETRAVADFVFIYIREAHPIDEQHFGPDGNGGVNISTHGSLEERREASGWLTEQEGVRADIYLDTMQDTASQAFNAFPDRMVIIRDGVCQYVGNLGPWGFNLDEVRQWIEQNTAIGASGDKMDKNKND